MNFRQLLALSLPVWLLGCQTDASFHEMDPDLNRMLEVPRYDPYESSEFFDDRMSMREPPLGTVPYASEGPVPALSTGMHGGRYLTQIPLKVTRGLLEKGRRHFEQVCAACHGMSGNGETVVAKHMERPPPSLHEERIRNLPLGKVYYVIRHGYGYMPGYAAHFDVRSRWAIVAYLLALQRSRHAELTQLPADIARAAEENLR